jgi:tetratricopeptide (TPR) repeat protein
MAEGFEQNLTWLEEQVKANGGSPLFARLALAYLDRERVDEALPLCIAGVAKFPDYVTGRLALGKCYLALKKYSDAKKQFERVLDLLPTSSRVELLLQEIGDLESKPKVKAPLPPSKKERRKGTGDVIPRGEAIVSPISTKQPPGLQQSLAEGPTLFDLKKPSEEPRQSVEEKDESAELEALAKSLEGAKIPRMSETEIPDPFLEETEEDSPPAIISETLASIYESQGGYEEAIAAYKVLIEQRPKEKGRFKKKIEELQQKIKERDDQ